MPRRRHLRALQLSEASRAIIVAAFEDGERSYETIAAEILARTGEKIGKSSVARYWPLWNVAQLAGKAVDAAREQAREWAALPKAQLEEVLENLESGRIYESLAEAEIPMSQAQALAAKDRAARRRQKERELDLETRRLEQKTVTTLDQVLEFWRAVVELVHAADPAAGQALTATSDRVIDGLKQKYSA